jgi:TonB family protein
MRRNILQVSLALLTFVVGFLVSGEGGDFVRALFTALAIFVPLKTIISMGISLHYLKVAVLTLLIWTPLAILTLNAIAPSGGTCELYFPDETKPLAEAQEKKLLPVIRQNSETATNNCGCSQSYTDTEPEQDGAAQKVPINGGVLNGRAVSLPKPPYPPIAKAARLSGNVVVQILVDERGCVQTARVLSGHPLLHEVSVQAARRACFYPTLLSGHPVEVKGVITYNFLLE